MLSILVIDDERPILKMLQLALTRFGSRVETAESGQEGIRKFESGHYDAVITDIQMPGMSGNEAAAHIRHSGKSAVVIGISGTKWLVDKPLYDLVLAKPFSLSKMDRAIKTLFSNHTAVA